MESEERPRTKRVGKSPLTLMKDGKTYEVAVQDIPEILATDEDFSTGEEVVVEDLEECSQQIITYLSNREASPSKESHGNSPEKPLLGSSGKKAVKSALEGL